MLLTYPERAAFSKLVKRTFVKAGWIIEDVKSDYCDFMVVGLSVKFCITCVDEKILSFRSADYLLGELENSSGYLINQKNQVLVTVLSMNFLRVNLRTLQRRKIWAWEISELSEILELANVSEILPTNVSERQLILLQQNVRYALFISRLLQEKSDYDAALSWAQAAVAASAGFTQAHLHLFDLMLKLGRLDEAEGLGKQMVDYRPTDNRVIRSMLNLSLKKGDFDQADEWKKKLTADNVPLDSFDAILKRSKQRQAPIVEVNSANLLENRNNGKVLTFLRKLIKT